MHVGMKEAVANGMAQEALDDEIAQRHGDRGHARASAGTSERGVPSIHSRVRTCRAVRAQSTRGTRKPGSSFDIARHFGNGRGFHAKVKFELHRLRKRVDGSDGTQPPHLGAPPLGKAGGEIEALDVVAELLLDSGAEDLDRHPSPSVVRALCTWAIDAAATGGPNSV